MTLLHQVGALFILAIPIACIAWTVTHEEIFREPRDFCKHCSTQGKNLFVRKFFYLFTCEYCFSHYITIAMVVFANFKLLLPDWRGYVIAVFSLVWIANVYMSLYALIKVDIKSERVEASLKEEALKEKTSSG